MNSKEIITRTLEFNNPERVGRCISGFRFTSVGCDVKTKATDWEKVERIAGRDTMNGVIYGQG